MNRIFMILKINGEKRYVPTLESIGQLLRHLEIGEDRIAVEVNSRILPRKEWDRTPVNDQDRIEIVQFVGGG